MKQIRVVGCKIEICNLQLQMQCRFLYEKGYREEFCRRGMIVLRGSRSVPTSGPSLGWCPGSSWRWQCNRRVWRAGQTAPETHHATHLTFVGCWSSEVYWRSMYGGVYTDALMAMNGHARKAKALLLLLTTHMPGLSLHSEIISLSKASCDKSEYWQVWVSIKKSEYWRGVNSQIFH